MHDPLTIGIFILSIPTAALNMLLFWQAVKKRKGKQP